MVLSGVWKANLGLFLITQQLLQVDCQSVCQCVSHTFQALWLIDAVHEGYLAWDPIGQNNYQW